MATYGNDEVELPKPGEPHFMARTPIDVRKLYRCRDCDKLMKVPVLCGSGKHLFCRACLDLHLVSAGWPKKSSMRLAGSASGMERLTEIIENSISPLTYSFHRIMSHQSKCPLCLTFDNYRYSVLTHEALLKETTRCCHVHRDDRTKLCVYSGSFRKWITHTHSYSLKRFKHQHD